MKHTNLFCVVLMLITVKLQQIHSLNVIYLDKVDGTLVNVKDPSRGTKSSGILKSHKTLSYKPGASRTVILSAPNGYGLLAAIRVLDLRPNQQDSLTLFANGIKGWPSDTYANIFSYQHRYYRPQENEKLFYAPNGQLGVTFNTGPNVFTLGYDGFELVYTVQANWTRNCNFYKAFRCRNGRCIADTLKCDGHNHCGDRSDQSNCYPVYVPGGTGRTIGIVCGVVVLVLAVTFLMIFLSLRARSRTVTQTVIHPPSSNLPSYPPSYPQPGVCYPPPPPPYSQYDQGVTHPVYH